MKKFFLIFGIIIVACVASFFYGFNMKIDIDSERVLRNAEYLLLEDKHAYKIFLDGLDVAEMKKYYKLYSMPGSNMAARETARALLNRICFTNIGEGWEREEVYLNMTSKKILECFVDCTETGE